MTDKNLLIMDHPLIQHKLSILRDVNTGTKEFKELVDEIATLIAYEATRDLPLAETKVQTPIEVATTKVLAGKKLAVVPILRAGLGMVSGMLNLIPAAKIGHIGLYRDPKTLEPVEYYCKLPSDIEERQIFVVDPMLATGGSASAAIGFIKKSPQKTELKEFSRIIPMYRFTAPQLTKDLTTTATFAPVSAMQATDFSAHFKNLFNNIFKGQRYFFAAL